MEYIFTLDNQEFEHLLNIDTKIISLEMQLIFSHLQADSIEFRRRLSQGSINAGQLFNSTSNLISLIDLKNYNEN